MPLQPFRVGVAGLGTVGASVLAILSRQDNALSARAGRARISVAAGNRLGPSRVSGRRSLRQLLKVNQSAPATA